MAIWNKILTNPFRKKSVTEINPLTYFSSVNSLFEYVYVSSQQAMRYYQTNSAIATSVDMIGKAVEQIQPVIRIGNEMITDHEILDMLLIPNGFNSWDEFIGSMSRYLNLTGNAYISASGNVDYAPLSLYATNPIHVSPQQAMDGYPNVYSISNTTLPGLYKRESNPKTLTRFKRDQLTEMYQIMLFSSRSNNIYGDSPMNAILAEIELINSGTLYNINILKNGGMPKMWIEFKDAPSEEQRRERKKALEEQISGPTNAGKWIVTGSDGNKNTDTNIKSLNTSNSDMDYENLISRATLAIYNRYEISLPLITNEASTYNNLEQAVLRFYTKAVIPHIETIFAGLTKFLIPRYKELKEKRAVITYNPYEIPSLRKLFLNELDIRKKIGIETINELRTHLPDLEDVEGGDVIPGQPQIMEFRPANDDNDKG